MVVVMVMVVMQQMMMAAEQVADQGGFRAGIVGTVVVCVIVDSGSGSGDRS